MSCSGLALSGAMRTHDACLEGGHRAGAHSLHRDGMVTCDTCAVLDAIAQLSALVADALDRIEQLDAAVFDEYAPPWQRIVDVPGPDTYDPGKPLRD